MQAGFASSVSKFLRTKPEKVSVGYIEGILSVQKNFSSYLTNGKKLSVGW